MGQEVKNPLRAQSKYGLMGSSAKTGKKIFRGSPEHFLDQNAFGIGHPPTYTSIAVYMCGGGFKGPKSLKRNSIISIRSKVMAFLVILLSPHGPCCPRVLPVIPTSSLSSPHHPHIVPVIPTLSPHHPHRPHSPQKVPMWSPWSVVSTCCPCHPHVVPVVPKSSPSLPRRPRHPHVIPVVPIAPRRSPCGLHGLWSPHVVPVVPTSFLSSPHHLEGPHIIPNPPDTHSTHPLPPGGWGAPNQ